MTKTVRKSYNSLKWVLGIMLFIATFLIGMSLYLSSTLKPIIKTQIKEMVLNGTDSLYNIEFSDISTNFITGRAALDDVKITPDTAVFKKLIALKKAPNNIYYIQLKKLAVKNFHPLNYFLNKRLKIDVLLFDNPDVVMVNQQFVFNETKHLFPDLPPYEYISRYLDELRVKVIDFKNIRFKYINNNLSIPETDSIKNLNITLKNWLIDKHSAQDKNRLYLLKDIVINLNNYTFATPDSMYYINLNQLDFTASSGKLNVKSFAVVPRYDEMKFGQVAGFAKDRLSIQMSDISMEGINLPLYVRRQELYAKEMNISNGFIEVFNNNSLLRKEVDRTGKYPHQLLQAIKGKLTVKQLNLSNIDVSYAEFDKDSRLKGKITFERTSGSITNITNVAKIKAAHPFMFTNLTSYIMGQGQLDVNFKFNLLARDGAFSYSGTLGYMDGRVLNHIIKPLGMVEVKSGHVKQLNFKIDANDHNARGNLDFAFKDLSVALLKKDNDRLVKQGLISFLANAMVINSDNPNAAGVLIRAPIKYDRIRTASFFSFVWKTLFQGIKYSVGVTPEKEQKIKAQIAAFEKMKADREKRRAERQKRKARQLK